MSQRIAIHLADPGLNDREIGERGGPLLRLADRAVPVGCPQSEHQGPPSIEPAGADRVELGRCVAIGLGEEVSVVDVGNATLE